MGKTEPVVSKKIAFQLSDEKCNKLNSGSFSLLDYKYRDENAKCKPKPVNKIDRYFSGTCAVGRFQEEHC